MLKRIGRLAAAAALLVVSLRLWFAAFAYAHNGELNLSSIVTVLSLACIGAALYVSAGAIDP